MSGAAAARSASRDQAGALARLHGLQVVNLRSVVAAGDALRVCRALSLEAAYLAAMGQGGEAEVEDLLRRAEVLANEQRNAHAQGVVSLARAFAAYLWGRYGSILRDASRTSTSASA